MATALSDFRDGRRTGLVVDLGDRDMRASGRESVRGGKADTRAAAGDNTERSKDYSLPMSNSVLARHSCALGIRRQIPTRRARPRCTGQVLPPYRRIAML